MSLYGKEADETISRLKHSQTWFAKHLVEGWKSPLMTEQSFNRDIREIEEMAKKALKAMGAKPKETEKVEWRGFIDVQLTAEMKERLADWDMEQLETIEAVAGLATAGYKFTLTWNSGSQSFVVSMTGMAGAGENAGLTLTAHARDAEKAVFVLMFKYMQVLPQRWEDLVVDRGDDFG